MASNNKKAAGFTGISVADSMFACLPCDDEAEVKRKNRGGKKKENDDDKHKKNDNPQNKNKKKEKNSLQSAAVLSNKSKKKSQTPVPQPQPSSPTPPAETATVNPDPEWEQWRERDAENVDTEYERNLEQALLISKFEADQADVLRAIAAGDPSPPPPSAPSSSASAAKKKKKKNNSESKAEKTVHLSTFLSETPDPTPVVAGADVAADDGMDAQERIAETNGDEDSLIITPRFATLMPRPKTYEVDATESACLGRGDAQEDFIVADRTKDGSNERDLKREKEAEEREFFQQVQRDVGKIIRKEECTEFLKQNEQLISEAVRSAQYRADIEEKDNLIEVLKKEIETMKEEFAKVKKRNKQLAFIISQGEMQEKADLLTEIDGLKEVKDELTSQTVDLQQELEQERTKNKTMTKELQALKGHKHGKHSSPLSSET